MIETIEQKISDILRNNKALSNQIEENQRKEEQLLDEVFLDAISVLDVFSREENVIADHGWNESEDSQKAIKRFLNVKKKLYSMLAKRGCVKTPNIKILNSLCVHLWMRNEFFIFL